MYKKILAAVDGSEKAGKALIQAAELAAKLGAELTVVHVVAPIPSMINTTPGRPPILMDNLQREISKELRAQGEELLKETRESLDGYNINLETQMLTGHPADEIIKKVKEGGYDLLVVGSRGLGEIKGFILGSVSNRVIRHASCPVLVVR